VDQIWVVLSGVGNGRGKGGGVGAVGDESGAKKKGPEIGAHQDEGKMWSEMWS
jgi:hypothetical protein